MHRIVVVATPAEALESLEVSFAGFRVQPADDLDAALELASPPPCEYVFVDLDALGVATGSPYREYRRALYPLWRAFPAARVVTMAPPARIRDAVRAVKGGASDYITYPITPDEVALVRESLDEELRTQGELDFLRDQLLGPEDPDTVAVDSAPMRAALDKARRVAPTPSTVLLTGETGTGKNVLASLIHRHSQRGDRQFISVHCGAIPDTLLESELFGHERGAFTGAVRRKLGKFEIAHGGTLLLDEIGTITPATQIKLLEVLQDHALQRVGGEERIEVDVRIIAATNLDLEQAVAEGVFRKDLYYRLRVFPIEIPPLRDRREDIRPLVEHFLDRYNGLHGKEIVEVSPVVIEAFHRYDWPGNVRELEGLVERAYILENSSVLTPESFPDELFASDEATATLAIPASSTLRAVRQRAIDDTERVYLKQLLEEHAGRMTRAAAAAGITDRQLRNLMRKHGLRKEAFRPGRKH